MVHFREDGDTNALSYWKLWPLQKWENPIHFRRCLSEAGIFCMPDSGVERLSYLRSRLDRGMISYDQYDLAELRELCLAREPGIPPNMNLSRTEWRYLLERIDEDGCTFSKFRELPTELRLQIYEHYISWLREHIYESVPTWRRSKTDAQGLLAPPPLAHTCRLLHHEVLPLFYQSFRWKVDFEEVYPCIWRWRKRPMPSPRLSDETSRFFRTVPPDIIHNLTKVQIEAKYLVTRRAENCCKDTWLIDLPPNDQPMSIQRRGGPSQWDDRDKHHESVELELREKIERDLRGLFEAMERQACESRWEREDVERVVAVYVRAQESIARIVAREIHADRWWRGEGWT